MQVLMVVITIICLGIAIFCNEKMMKMAKIAEEAHRELQIAKQINANLQVDLKKLKETHLQKKGN